MSATDIRITRVETVPLRVPFRTPFKIAQGAARPSAEIFIVRLHTDAGVSGVGETQAWRRQGSSETLQSLQATVAEHYAPLLVGRSPFDIGAIMPALEEAMYHSLYAQAAISDALYDLQGKILGVPVHALIGGRCRDELEACAVLAIKPTVELTVAGAMEYRDKGFRAYTVKVGVDLGADVETVRELRRQLGDEAILRVDANAGMNFDAALDLLRRLEPYGLDAAEQLVPAWDLQGMAELARRSPVPLMADECVATDHDLLELIRLRAATIVQTKIAKNGGIWWGRRLWHIAAAAGMRIYPGNHPSTSVATAAALHLAASWHGPLLEGAFAVGLLNLAEDIVKDPPQWRGAKMVVPEGPGLGVTLDEAQLDKFRVAL
jgi:L-alanine-DL-glutamate epimerase-like enolase superfamily enzyme